MRAVLDHIGIAVTDLPAALAFYRDALGLEVEAPEEVAAQRVRAHFIPVGGANLELLEATAPDSPIARYVDKKGPGLHHITLRVDDIHAAVAQMKARGVRMIDDAPRRGAEGSTIAFVHPSAAHGVLVELKQSGARLPVAISSAAGPIHDVARFTLGNFELISVADGSMRLDGGAMFGVVPKMVWSREVPADHENRVKEIMRCLVVRGARTMLIDAGLGDKDDEAFCEMYGVERRRNLDHTLAEAGLSVDDIDIVLASHLHFDHSGGFTRRDATGRVRPRFPRAQYVVRRGEWEDALRPNARNRANYVPDNYEPLADAGVLQLVDDDQTIMPGVRVQRTGGHTMHHQMIVIESGGKSAAFVADLMPMTQHVRDVWMMGFDTHPLDTLSAKAAVVRDAIAKETLVFFPHDERVIAGYIREQNGERYVEAMKP